MFGTSLIKQSRFGPLDGSAQELDLFFIIMCRTKNMMFEVILLAKLLLKF